MYLFILHRLAGKCTKIYNACRTIARLINPLFCDVFAAVVVCARSLLLWSIKSHDVDLSMFCLLLYLWFKPWSHCKIPSEQSSSSTLKKDCPMEISGNSPRNFWSNGECPWTRKSIPESGVSRQTIRQQIGKVIYGVSTKTESRLSRDLTHIRPRRRGRRLVKNVFVC